MLSPVFFRCFPLETETRGENRVCIAPANITDPNADGCLKVRTTTEVIRERAKGDNPMFAMISGAYSKWSGYALCRAARAPLCCRDDR